VKPIAAICALALAFAAAAIAIAATPKAGGKYTGKSSTGKSVVIKVSKSRKSGRFIYCEDAQGVKFKIKHGKFTAKLSVQGPGTVFKATGKFTSKRKVRGRITQILTCDGEPAKYSAKLK
jgi:hypothetical protein